MGLIRRGKRPTAAGSWALECSSILRLRFCSTIVMTQTIVARLVHRTRRTAKEGRESLSVFPPSLLSFLAHAFFPVSLPLPRPSTYPSIFIRQSVWLFCLLLHSRVPCTRSRLHSITLLRRQPLSSPVSVLRLRGSLSRSMLRTSPNVVHAKAYVPFANERERNINPEIFAFREKTEQPYFPVYVFFCLCSKRQR